MPAVPTLSELRQLMAARFPSSERREGCFVAMPAMFEKRRLAITQSAALVIEGKVQSREGVIHVLAERIDPLVATDLPVGASHDFH